MPRPRPFPFPDCQAGVFHVCSRFAGKARFCEDDAQKAMLLRFIRAYETLLGVRVLTYCLMANHFHILVQVPHRPPEHAVGPGTGPDLETILTRLEAAVGEKHMRLVRNQIDLWQQAGNAEALEEWRQRQVARMYSLSEFVRCVKQRYTRWFNALHERTGILWESRFTSVIVEDEVRALRTMATYIDLNPVRAGLTADPADYPWSGYAAAMRGETQAQQGLARIVNGGGLDSHWSAGSTATGRLRALIRYRHLLGCAGRPRRRADGTVVRRGVPEKIAARLSDVTAGGVQSEVLLRRLRHFTKGVIFGSRACIDDWFQRNRGQHSRGRSREERQTGARPMGRPGLRGLYTLRALATGAAALPTPPENVREASSPAGGTKATSPQQRP